MAGTLSYIKSNSGSVNAFVSDAQAVTSMLNVQQLGRGVLDFNDSILFVSWENGRFDADTGLPVESSTQYRTVDYIGTSAFDTLVVESSDSTVLYVFKYDKAQSFNGYDEYRLSAGNTVRVPLSSSLIKLAVYIEDGFPTSANTVPNEIRFRLSNFTSRLRSLYAEGFCDLFDLVDSSGLVDGRYDTESGSPITSAAQMRVNKIPGLNGAMVKVECLDPTDPTDNLVAVYGYDTRGKYLGYRIYTVRKSAPCFFRIGYDVAAFAFAAKDKKVKEYLKITVFSSPCVTQGMKYSILGDSLSTFSGVSVGDGAFYPRTGLSNESDTWWRRLEEMTGMELDTNNSLSSSCVSGTDSTYTPMSDDSRLANLGSPDVVFVAGGTNDIYTNKPSGEWAGYKVDDQDVSNFTQAFTKVISYIQSNYKARVVCISPTFIYEGLSGREHCTIENINRICSIEEDVCDKMGAVFVDTRKCGLTKYNYAQLTVDGLHWNAFITSSIAYEVYKAIREFSL